MNPWIPIISTYGIEFARDLALILAKGAEPTAEDFQELITKYGTKSLHEKLADYLKLHPELVKS